MIVDKVVDYLEGPGADMREQDVQTAKALIGRTLHRNFGKRRTGEPRMQSPSSTWACQRRRIYDADPNTPPEPLSARARRTFAFGDVTEAIGIALARQAGVEFESPTPTGKQREVHAKFAGLVMKGHLDADLIHPDYGLVPVDYKSMSDFSFKRALAGSTDPAGEWWERERWGIIAQMRWYLFMLHWMLEQGLLPPEITKVAEFGLIIAVDKSTGHMAELRVYQDDSDMQMLMSSFTFVAGCIDAMHKDGKSIEEIIENTPRPSWTETKVSKRKVEAPGGGKAICEEINTQGGNRWRCGYCPYTAACWPGFEVVPMKSGPVWRKRVESNA